MTNRQTYKHTTFITSFFSSGVKNLGDTCNMYIVNIVNVPGDIFFYRRLLDGHHGNWAIGRQPVRTIIATSVMADVVDVAKQEGHRREFSYTRAGITCFIIIYEKSFISLHQKNGILSSL